MNGWMEQSKKARKQKDGKKKGKEEWMDGWMEQSKGREEGKKAREREKETCFIM